MITSGLRTVALLVLFYAFWGSEARSRALLQDASPCGQVSSSGPVNITTNSVVLITSPLVSANEALTICSCLPGCYTLANQGDLLPSNPNVPSGAEGLKILLNQNLDHGQGAWLASPYNCTSVDTGPDGSIIETGLADCGGGQATLCSKSRITRNGEGAPCDNQLEQCAAGLYCDPQTNTCAPDMVCQPENPCASDLTGPEASNAFCTVNSTAPGGYTCQCGPQTAVSLGPGPQQCVLCPSANPCAATLCPVGSYCEFTCGDPRGPVCTPSDGTAASP